MGQILEKSPARSLSKTVLLFLLFTSSVAVATDLVDFTIVDRIQFSVPSSWPVIASKSDAEKTVFAFQIPNKADKGTPDSSNLAIISLFFKDAEAKDTFEKKASNPENDAQERKLVDGWRCYTFSGMQGATQYVVWDCYGIVGDCGVSVRIAWPHLPKIPPDYDAQMEAVLSDFLMSVVPSKKQ